MQHLSSGPLVRGKDFEGPATIVPYELLKNFKPFPTAFSISHQTVTLGASVTKPLALWAGDDLIFERKNLTYTFTEAANTILSSAGVETTGQSSALGVWYFYLAISKNFSTQVASNTLIPSQTAPAAIDFEKNTGYLGHPGTSATKRYVYVGCVICSKATGPAFVNFTKVGNNYLFLESEKIQVVTPGTSYAAAAFTRAKALPAHDGVKVSGWGETAAGDTVKIAHDANGSGAIFITGATIGGMKALGTSTFTGFPLNSGNLYALHGSSAGVIHITGFEDII